MTYPDNPPMLVPTEADVHFELYRHLQNSIERQRDHGNIRYGRVECERSVNGGYADVVVWDSSGRARIVVETKRQTEDGRYRRGIDPYSPEVIRQAFGYAGLLGADYFATFNGVTLVLFKTFEQGTHLMDRQSRAYRVSNLAEFSTHLLDELGSLEAGEIRWDSLDRAFVNRLSEFHRILTPHYRMAASAMLSNGEFRRRYNEWTLGQGWGVSPEVTMERFAAQGAYLLMNKIVFHKILEDSSAYSIRPIRLDTHASLNDQLHEAFQTVVKTVDFEPVYSHDSTFDEVVLGDDGMEIVVDFIRELDGYSLSRFDQDVIGRIYERVIPPEERHSLGQYYTPPEVVDLICRLTITSPEDTVLDPACGSGGFLVGAYNRLKSLSSEDGHTLTHTELTKRVFGIDINRFPAHLSAINLALRNLAEKTRKVNIEVADFFHILPGQGRMVVEVASAQGSTEVQLAFPEKVKVVVANPPYIRQENITDKESCRRHLLNVGAGSLNEQSDIYCYFFTHSREFLERGGRIGFITSNLWLAVRYGEALQEWLLNNFRIIAVIHPIKRVFERQLVPTCVTILEECQDKASRDMNAVKFMMVKAPLSIDEIARIVESDHGRWVVDSRETHRVMTVMQTDLQGESRWHRYLYAPPIYWLLAQHESLVELKQIATVKYGLKTGMNAFFMIEEDTVQEFGIERQFLRVLVKSPRDIRGLKFDPSESSRCLLDMHDFVRKSLRTSEMPSRNAMKEVADAEEEYRLQCQHCPRRLNSTELRLIALLKKKGFKGTYQYMLWGLKNGAYHNETCLARSIWFHFGRAPSGRLLAPENIRGRPFFPLLDKDAVHGNKLFSIHCDNESDLEVVAAFLNSSVGKLFFECHGRIQRGGIVSLMVYDVESFPVLDPSTITKAQRSRIIEAYERLTERRLHEDEAGDILDELDRSVLAAFGYEDRAREVTEIARALSSSRQQQMEYEIPVDVEQPETIIVPGGMRLTRRRTQTAIGDFNED